MELLGAALLLGTAAIVAALVLGLSVEPRRRKAVREWLQAQGATGIMLRVSVWGMLGALRPTTWYYNVDCLEADGAKASGLVASGRNVQWVAEPTRRP